ncbi:YheC/YheD family protein [Bacillus sp. JJ1532]|uniref:YheC/YheD family protein n=1 Tax=unclassified Bacillus (in: firmicutes) TaxID=185979 RepID=UPI002FFDE94D
MKYLGNNKWTKYSIMMENKALQNHLPETSNFSESGLWDLVDKYSTVILKPSSGKRGRNIFKLSSLGEGRYEIHYEDKIDLFFGRNKTIDYLNNKIDFRSYLIQRFIPLLTINGSPFDMRVITQRYNDSNTWFVTGKVAKVAGKGFIVTNNELSGGSVLHVKQAIQNSHLTNSPDKIDFLLSEIDRVALLGTNCLAGYYKEKCIFGFDIGIDQLGHIWIIEGNSRPSLSHFYKLGDKATYRTIREIQKKNL